MMHEDESTRMNIVHTLLLALCIAGVGNAAAAETQTQSDVGKFVIVPAGSTQPTDKLPVRFSAWRLNTETGDVEFCSYVGGSATPGGLTTESLRCIPEIPAAKPHDK